MPNLGFFLKWPYNSLQPQRTGRLHFAYIFSPNAARDMDSSFTVGLLYMNYVVTARDIAPENMALNSPPLEFLRTAVGGYSSASRGTGLHVSTVPIRNDVVLPGRDLHSLLGARYEAWQIFPAPIRNRKVDPIASWTFRCGPSFKRTGYHRRLATPGSTRQLAYHAPGRRPSSWFIQSVVVFDVLFLPHFWYFPEPQTRVSRPSQVNTIKRGPFACPPLISFQFHLYLALKCTQSVNDLNYLPLR